MSKKITKTIFIAIVATIGYTNLQAQGIGVVDHKGTKNTINNVISGTTAPTNAIQGTKGDMYRKVNGTKVEALYIYTGGVSGDPTSEKWEKISLTGTEGSVFFADSNQNPTENNTNFFWDDTNKRLGIGNKAPTKTLDVSTSARLGNTHIGKREGTTADANDEIAAIGANMTGNRKTALEFYSDGSTNYKRASYSGALYRMEGVNGVMGIRNRGAGGIVFKTDNSNQIRILSGGTVGIGTDTPTEKLDVNGKVKIRSLNNLSTIGTHKMVVVGTDGVLKKTTLPELTGTEGSVFFADTDGKPTEDNANFFWDNTNNRLGIGTVTPTQKLDVYGKVRVRSFEDLSTIGTNKMVVVGNDGVLKKTTLPELTGTEGSVFFADTDGKPTEDNANFFWDNTNNRLGIGTVTPTQKLDVNGEVKVRTLQQLSHIGATDNMVAVNENGVLKKIAYPSTDKDIKFSLKTADHGHWYLANGRTITTKSGKTVKLPDLRNRFLQMFDSRGTPTGTNGKWVANAINGIFFKDGNDFVTLTKDNIPELTGTTNTAGEHKHSNTSFVLSGSDNAGNTHNGTYNAYLGAAGAPRRYTFSYDAAGAHSHSVVVNKGNRAKVIRVTNPYISVNIFYYVQ